MKQIHDTASVFIEVNNSRRRDTYDDTTVTGTYRITLVTPTRLDERSPLGRNKVFLDITTIDDVISALRSGDVTEANQHTQHQTPPESIVARCVACHEPIDEQAIAFNRGRAWCHDDCTTALADALEQVYNYTDVLLAEQL